MEGGRKLKLCCASAARQMKPVMAFRGQEVENQGHQALVVNFLYGSTVFVIMLPHEVHNASKI